jgi:hypothetical protein
LKECPILRKSKMFLASFNEKQFIKSGCYIIVSE